jgi:hypothetical protein
MPKLQPEEPRREPQPRSGSSEGPKSDDSVETTSTDDRRGQDSDDDRAAAPVHHQNRGDIPGTDEPPAVQESSVDDEDDPRRVAHELLGQAHAVLTIAVRKEVLPTWCPPELRPSVEETTAKIATAVGEGQAAIASGRHDEALIDAGIGGVLARPKRKGLRYALERLIGELGHRRKDQSRKWLRSAAGWAKLAVTSIAKSVPGIEVVAEGLDVILSAIDTSEAVEAVQAVEMPEII